MLRVFVDADACPVKDEVYRVARRCGLQVFVVANAFIRVPDQTGVELVVVGGDFDAADDWIVARVEKDDIVVSDDIPLAARCLEKGAWMVSPRGRSLTEETIGDALASRELLSQLRDMGTITGGPAPLEKKDRSRFLQRLDQIIQAIRRGA